MFCFCTILNRKKMHCRRLSLSPQVCYCFCVCYCCCCCGYCWCWCFCCCSDWISTKLAAVCSDTQMQLLPKHSKWKYSDRDRAEERTKKKKKTTRISGRKMFSFLVHFLYVIIALFFCSSFRFFFVFFFPPSKFTVSSVVRRVVAFCPFNLNSKKIKIELHDTWYVCTTDAT